MTEWSIRTSVSYVPSLQSCGEKLKPGSRTFRRRRRRAVMDDRKRPARGDEKPAAKKHKDNVQSSHRLDALDSFVLETVFSFLDSRTLFNVAFCSKAIRARVTHEAVVRSAVLSGGVATKTIQRMTFLLELRAIWVPSPLRLLRLVNGRSCERGDLCC